MITQDSIQKVIETARVEEVIDEFVQLKRAGVNLKGLCPFHNEKTPSFSVSPSKNIFKCFGCGRGGNSVQFLMEHEKLSFVEAIRWLADKYNIELEETKPSKEAMERNEERDSIYIINEFARKHFEKNLFQTDEGRAIGLSYFRERGYHEATIKKFGLGYSLRSRQSLHEQLKGGQFNLERSEKIGLIKEGRDFFNGRVMFSIHNLSGKVIGFGGRTMSKDKKVPKYINSQESDIYNKRSTLYGLYHSKTPIRKADECILVEGYTDVLTLHQSGLENVVAASGTSLTEQQISLIKRYTRNIKIIFDGDPAGIRAAIRGLDMVLTQDMNVKLVLLPEGEDPDSYLKKLGADQFIKFIKEQEKDFIHFKTELLIAEAGNDPIQKSIAIKSIIESISKIPDTLKRSLYIKEYSDILELDESILHAESNKMIRGEARKEQFRRTGNKDYVPQSETKIDSKLHKQGEIQVESDLYQEKDVVRILMSFGSLLTDLESDYSIAEYIIDNTSDIINEIDNKVYKKILLTSGEEFESGMALDQKHFLNHSDPEIQKTAVDLLSTPYSYANWSAKGLELQTQRHPDENHMEDARQAVLRLKARKFRKKLKETESNIIQIEEDNPKKIIYIKVYQKLKSDLAEILKELRTVISH